MTPKWPDIVSSNQVINTQVGCAGDKIIILADTTGLTFQNDTFKVVIVGIEDIYGNKADTISWVFNVQGPEVFEPGEDEDTDGDGVINSQDNCPIAYNPDQADMDGDGIGDLCDSDLDGDGVNNDLDNCPFHANPNQEDSNSNGIGDVCDVTGIEQFSSDAGYKVFDNYPNPFSRYTTFKYKVPVMSKVVIRIYNIMGQEVKVLATDNVSPGIHETTWYSGTQESGIYFYTISVTKPDGSVFMGRKKMILYR